MIIPLIILPPWIEGANYTKSPSNFYKNNVLSALEFVTSCKSVLILFKPIEEYITNKHIV
jgi:hypothetical protein